MMAGRVTSVQLAEEVATESVRIFVAIATIGRPETLRSVVDFLERQARAPDGIVIATVSITDAGDVLASPMRPEIILSEKGLCRQRNAALRHIAGRADIVIFLDDDYVMAADYLAELERIFVLHPDVVGTTGRLIADGIHHKGYSFSEAVALVDADKAPAAPQQWPADALYGCNMALRLSAMDGLQFDEALPLYGWLEDIDLTYRLARNGRLIRSERLAGVHMGTKGGRTSGMKTGYSQIANPLYLLRKKSAPPSLAFGCMARNLIANLVRSLLPEPYVDRWGRLRGNLLALAHLVTGRLDPRHILNLP